ncbi:MAG: ABC transporter permease, partial [Planctomycetes bacterium]|nr:ABC transporter permease [Planctomycetota bacterium]
MFPIGTMMRIAMRSLRLHALSTTVTAISAALACGLVMAVFAVARQSNQAFQGGALGFDAVLGAR